MAGADWSLEEVELVVADYLEMFGAWCAGQGINKAQRRKNLQTKLGDRTDSSVDRKRSNISAILDELGFHYLPGFKPLHNYQQLLKSVVVQRIASAPWLDQVELAASEQPAVSHSAIDFTKVKAAPPKSAPAVKEPSSDFFAIRRDYTEREARNRSLGRAGEELVLEFERWRLTQLGESGLAAKVDWVAKTKGDGLGYDVRSFNATGEDKFIEVKTTAFGISTPFFLTSTELRFSELYEANFFVYRVFEFRAEPKLFVLDGSPKKHCLLDPVSYRASFS
jgi:hypothetical protein